MCLCSGLAISQSQSTVLSQNPHLAKYIYGPSALTSAWSIILLKILWELTRVDLEWPSMHFCINQRQWRRICARLTTVQNFVPQMLLCHLILSQNVDICILRQEINHSYFKYIIDVSKLSTYFLLKICQFWKCWSTGIAIFGEKSLTFARHLVIYICLCRINVGLEVKIQYLLLPNKFVWR